MGQVNDETPVKRRDAVLAWLRGRAVVPAVLAVAAILTGAYSLGLAVDPYVAPASTAASPSASATATPVTRPAAQERARRNSEPMAQPITGPNRPPLPEDRNGPFGSRMTTGMSYVALTFDDGPDPNYTPQALALLRRYEVRATFCLVGENARRYPHLVRAIVADGHTLCNHSWNHDFALGARGRTVIENDLRRTNEAILAAVPGEKISYFRHPGGNWTPGAVAVAREMGMTSLHWTVDPQDWTVPGAGSIAATVNAGAHPGAIVLLHDAGGNRQGTVNALRSILPNVGRRFLLEALPAGIDQPPRFGLELPLHPGQI
ncbi:polysaccharide deacetylase family protein [Polymorphospora sp. 2-325]|uniref:Polysaccharide deacetylase family protein n=1 Tax=Polymorphospora lycopeni TaxID=3140240 RepID=A0ABV5CMD3_9ACTN